MQSFRPMYTISCDYFLNKNISQSTTYSQEQSLDSILYQELMLVRCPFSIRIIAVSCSNIGPSKLIVIY